MPREVSKRGSELRDALAQIAAGYEGSYALISHLCDQLVEHWHNTTDADVPLSEWMGLSPDQYAMFAEGRYSDLVNTFIGQD